MSDPAIRFDKTKYFSEVRGDRQPDDPHYRVAYFQSGLPFDVNGNLVPDDGRLDPYTGMVDGKPVQHHPLYTPAMRELLEKKKARLAKGLAAVEQEAHEDEDTLEQAAEDVNFPAYLRGESDYPWGQKREAALKRFSKRYTSEKELVRDLVLDERVVPEDQVCARLAKMLGDKAAA